MPRHNWRDDDDFMIRDRDYRDFDRRDGEYGASADRDRGGAHEPEEEEEPADEEEERDCE